MPHDQEPGLKPAWIVELYAALKRCSSTVVHASVVGRPSAAEAGLILWRALRRGLKPRPFKLSLSAPFGFAQGRLLKAVPFPVRVKTKSKSKATDKSVRPTRAAELNR